MRVLLTVNAAWNVWNFRLPLVAALLAEGHEVTVLAPVDDSVTMLREMGCNFVPLPMNVKGLNPLEGVKLVQRFKQQFRVVRPDVVLSYTIKNNIFGAMAARAVGVPFIPNVTGLGTAFLSGGLLQAVAEGLYRRAFRGLSAVFFQNADDRDLFVQRRLIASEQARLLPGSGINLQRFTAAEMPAAGSTPVFLMIARLLRDKGVLEYVEAARRVKTQHPQARFQLLGAVDADNRTAIDRATVERWVADGLVEYLGTTVDVRPFIAAAHCVVLPSYREGAPRTLIEAAAMARPLIATDVPGCRAVVDDGVNGYLCAVRDGASLADAVMRFMALPHAAQVEMGQAGRLKMRHEFDESLVVEAYQSVISAAYDRAQKLQL